MENVPAMDPSTRKLVSAWLKNPRGTEIYSETFGASPRALTDQEVQEWKALNPDAKGGPPCPAAKYNATRHALLETMKTIFFLGW